MKPGIKTKTGIKWKENRYLGDFNYADDICLIHSSVSEMQDKTEAVSKQASILGLIINNHKTEVMRPLNDT